MSYAVALEAIAKASAVLAVIAAVNNSLVAEPIAQLRHRRQKQMWLRRLATGESLGRFALSEEAAGSDAANQQTVARLDERGYVINGRKVWVANAEAADLVIVFAATQPDTRGRGISAFLVPMEHARHHARRHRGLAWRARARVHGPRARSTCASAPTRCSVRRARASASRCGRSTAGASRLPRRRSASAPPRSKRRCTTRRRARRSASRSANYQAIQWMLADMATELDAARMLTLKAADARQRQRPADLDASMAKLFASEAAHRAADKAMQILASKGYRRGSVVERLFRDVRATEIYQGTSEIQRMVIEESAMTILSIADCRLQTAD